MTRLNNILTVTLVAVLFFGMLLIAALGKDDGRYANSPLRGWFSSLTSKHGALCCAEADGNPIKDVEWDSKEAHYRVELDGQWYDVPDEALVSGPNWTGVPLVWTYFQNGQVRIRCFMPGAGG